MVARAQAGRVSHRWLPWLALAALAACAFDVLRLDQRPAQLEATPAPGPALVMSRDTEVTAGAYKRVLRKGTRWMRVGRIAAGDVYQTRDQVLTVEASNMHEAYLVVAAGNLMGFYLPVERTYVPTEPVALALER